MTQATAYEAQRLIPKEILDIQGFMLNILSDNIHATHEVKSGSNLDEDRSAKDLQDTLNSLRQRRLFLKGMEEFENSDKYLDKIVLEINCTAAIHENSPIIIEALSNILRRINMRFGKEYSLDQNAGKKENTIILLTERLREKLEPKVPHLKQELPQGIQKVLRKAFDQKTPKQTETLDTLIRANIEAITTATLRKIEAVLEGKITIEQIQNMLAEHIQTLFQRTLS